jgi:hypothetical protein
LLNRVTCGFADCHLDHGGEPPPVNEDSSSQNSAGWTEQSSLSRDTWVPHGGPPSAAGVRQLFTRADDHGLAWL